MQWGRSERVRAVCSGGKDEVEGGRCAVNIEVTHLNLING